ncbi:protein atonal homolog 8 isoform X1 [Trichosurus vulpecula]|uniref:protein atonal homolog 8 isoform X1 n=1 Tax=Trichosurus vulpecula TaxID=9337 RepID=UPI00186AE518|nr:protein atonal homolog 8 isoform X1 [Trichosurus vulpecula]
MKSLPTLEGGPWPSLCIKEVSCPKKLKRKTQEGPRRVNGYKSFRADLKVPEPAANGLRERTERLLPAKGAAVAAAVPEESPELLLLPGDRSSRSCGGGPRGGEVLDMRKRCFPPGPGRGLPPSPPPLPPGLAALPGSRDGREAPQTFGDQSVRSRIVLCPPAPRQPVSQPPPPPAPQPQPPQPQQQQPRPAGSSFSSISHVIYNNNPDSSAASPRKRLGETAGVSSEIKAIQQTRRLLANARERTRVHTISAAFEALRKQVPCYSYGQKLSKLAILRIACNYILSLARLADLDYSADHSNMSFSECVEQCTRTLQAEGRSKKRKVGSG